MHHGARTFAIEGRDLSDQQWQLIATYLLRQYNISMTETTPQVMPPLTPKVATVSYDDMLQYALQEKGMTLANAKYYVGRIWAKFIRTGSQQQYGLQFEHPLKFGRNGAVDPKTANGLHLDSLALLLMRLDEEMVRLNHKEWLFASAIERIMLPGMGAKYVVFLQDYVKARLQATE